VPAKPQAAAAAAAAPAPATSTQPARRPLTVSQLTSMIERALRDNLPQWVFVQGEVSNFNHHRGSGHIYFTLKDAEACVDCVIFRSDAQRIRFRPDDGIELIAGGRIAVYPSKGRYQLYVSTLQPVGRGALELAFQQLYAKLKAEGLFAPERKKPLPAYPLRIAMITSRQTAALQDMLKVLRRFPWLRLFVYHVPVQGDGSAEQIAAAIAHLSAAVEQSNIDVILLARGGGALEDLWEFNEELLARAIASSRVPVVTGIGHEVDTCIADLVADHHAHTPTEAAQIVTAGWRTVRDQLDMTGGRLRRALRGIVQDARHRLMYVERHAIFRRPIDRINVLRQLLDDRHRSLVVALGHRLRREQSRVERIGTKLLECHPRHAIGLTRQRLEANALRLSGAMEKLHQRHALRLDALGAQLEALSPQRVLRRGYSITVHKKRGKPIRSAKELDAGDKIITRFVDGSVESTVDDPDQPSLFE
jgi:exodeoxyribonuclease VII large subunit